MCCYLVVPSNVELWQYDGYGFIINVIQLYVTSYRQISHAHST